MLPACGLPRIPIPTAPIINNGPELLQKASIRWASSFVIDPSLYKEAISLGPVGYPDVMLMIHTKELWPGQLKIGLITGVKITDRKSTTPNSIIISDTIKKGSKAGKTMLNQVSRPFKEAASDCSG